MRVRRLIGVAVVAVLGLGGWLVADALIIRSELNGARAALVAAKRRPDQPAARPGRGPGDRIACHRCARRRPGRPTLRGRLPVTCPWWVAPSRRPVTSPTRRPACSARCFRLRSRRLGRWTPRPFAGTTARSTSRGSSAANPDLHEAARLPSRCRRTCAPTPEGRVRADRSRASRARPAGRRAGDRARRGRPGSGPGPAAAGC